MRRSLPFDWIDLASVPYFATTMVAEARYLDGRPERREPGELLRAEGAVDGDDEPDRLVPVGFDRSDTLASLAMLVGNIASTLATQGPISRFNGRLFSRRLLNLGRRRGSLLAALVAWDLLYYWSHRIQHEHRLLWGNHVSHHSSRRYNLSTALRQPWSEFLLAWVHAPMPLAGFTLAQTARAGQLNLLYQYWIHTEAIDRLPPQLERFLNTPSHHRVHHGRNPEYLDKNYGGVLIVWDKLFGTFEPEVRRVDYGLTKNISTHNPIRIAYHELADLARDVRRTPRLGDKLRRLWRPPGWESHKEAVR